MAAILKGYRGNSNPEDPIKNITSTYVRPTEEEKVEKKETRATKHNWSDKRRLRKGLDIDTEQTTKINTYNVDSKTYDSSTKENVAKYITTKKLSERQQYSPNLSTDVSATPSTIDKSKYKNVFKKGDYIGTVKKRVGDIKETFQSNPAPSGKLNINLPKVNLPKINLPVRGSNLRYKGSNLQSGLRRAGSKVKQAFTKKSCGINMECPDWMKKS